MSFQNRLLCLKPWENIIVYNDGTVKFCCFMSTAQGNLNYETFTNIWNGNMAKRIRRQILNSIIPEECLNCPLVHEYTSLTVKKE